MILKDSYHPLTHLREIKKLFQKSIDNDEIITDVHEESNIDSCSDKEIVSIANYPTIFQDLATLITNYDLYLTQINDNTTKSLIEYLQNSIIDLLVKYGAEEFTDTYYHSLSDIIVPFRIVEEQTPIKKTLRPGLKFNDTIILRSLVEI